MSDYIASVICASLLSGAASLLSPEKWRKYVGVITGLCVICTVISPLAHIRPENILAGFDEKIDESVMRDGEQLREDMIRGELQRRVEEDIDTRLYENFGVKTKSSVEIGIDPDGKITGVKSVRLKGGAVTPPIQDMLKEVYGVGEISVE